MPERRDVWLLTAVGLFIVAAVIAFDTLRTPVEYYSIETPQYSESTTIEKSRYTVNVNAASAEELLGLKYISKNVAENIVRYRTENGRFYEESDLLQVPGVGEKTLEQIRPYITLE